MRSISWRWAITTCAASAAVGLGCWTASAASDHGVTVPVVSVTAGKPTEFDFTLSKANGLPPVVTFAVTNRGAQPHSFIVGGAATGILRPGQASMLTVSFERPGTYAYRSGMPGQAAKGMTGRLVVVGRTAIAKPGPAALLLGALATPSPVDPPVLEAAPATAAEPDPPLVRGSQCGDCHYDD